MPSQLQKLHNVELQTGPVNVVSALQSEGSRCRILQVPEGTRDFRCPARDSNRVLLEYAREELITQLGHHETGAGIPVHWSLHYAACRARDKSRKLASMHLVVRRLDFLSVELQILTEPGVPRPRRP
jgi:hypothetical protein